MHDFAMWLPAIITVLTAIFIAGQMTGRLKHHEEVIKDHDERLNDHDERLAAHGIALAEGKAWREGYNAAKAVK